MLLRPQFLSVFVVEPGSPQEMLRDRESAIDRMCKASVEERQKMLEEPILKAPVPAEATAVLDGLKT